MDRLKNTTGTSAQALEQQEKTVENLKRALQGAEDDYVAAGTALTNWSTSINNANADLNKMNSGSAEDRAVHGGSEKFH